MENEKNCSCGKCNVGSFIAGILVFALIAGALYYFWNLNQEKEELEMKVNQLQEKVVTPAIETELNVEIKEEKKVEVEKKLVVEKSEVEVVYPVDTFQTDAEGNFSGKLTVSGYPTIKKVTQGFCDPGLGDVCEEFDYVSFNLTGNYSPVLSEFSNGMQGNSFIGEDRIGLGCMDSSENTLYYYNDSQEFGMKDFKLSEEDTIKLFTGSMNFPITITLERKPFFGGSGAPDCYSHFTNITVY